jgi:hypothetical protein
MNIFLNDSSSGETINYDVNGNGMQNNFTAD